MLYIKSRMDKSCLLVMVMVIPAFLSFGKDNPKWVKEKIERVHIGNFALPVSQQPGPLVGFGQNVIDKGDLQIFAFVDQFAGKQKSFVEIAPSILYGINDKLSIFIELPVEIKLKIEQFKARGLGDLLVQLEGVAYAQETSSMVNEITLLVNMTFPTGSARKEPPTGFGAPSFFLGFTASHSATDWYCFTAVGTILTTSHKHTKFGNQFLYQFGFSKNISYKPDTWIFNWMVELDGIYRERNTLLGVIDHNSGGNDLILGPSLWFSTQQLILQLGISAVVAQHLFGIQPKDTYYIAANVGWKF